ncbi:MAG: Calcium-transporting ATPase 1 [Tenericutes bacterium ADurb.BinA155]|nr:MAG: Calcium-transporting ATPase 1 [Tenericutes bacterium ADurb.BinA155]
MKLPLTHKTLEEKIAAAPRYDVSFNDGLTPEQVQARREEGLYNKTRKHPTKSYAQIVFDNVFNFFNVLLVIIFVAMLFGHLPATSYFFMVILVANMTIGLIQDIHARHLVDRLRLLTDPKAKIVRNGTVLSLPVDDVVLGDILQLDAGDQICSDAVLVDGSCHCDESLLTGESVAVEKAVGDHVLSGSFLTKGHCRVRVEKIGAANYAETIEGKASSFRRPKSEIKSAIGQIFVFAGVITIVLGLTMTITWAAKADLSNPDSYQRFIQSTSGSLVAMIPAGMYLLTSLTLAVGVILLARKRMLVQELYCIEMLARVDVLCLDKTGTLTDGSMNVEHIYPVSDFTDEQIDRALQGIVYGTADSNATAMAIKKYYPDGNGQDVISFICFDSALKYSAASFKEGTYVLGAPGFVKAKDNREGDVKLDSLTKAGFRVLGLYFNKTQISEGKINGTFELVALVSLSDHIKEDAASNIAWFKNNGVEIRVISGDNPITVSQIAVKVGVPNGANYVNCTGKSDAELEALSKDHTVFGRVTPEQKEVLINAYKKQGHTVAMTGDGVNDILALKSADCSIAMASGAEAARNVSYLVSLDNDFSKLPAVVDQGRRVINNLQRTCSLFLSKTLFAMTLSVIFLITQWSGQIAYPFSTQNMLVWEGVSIGVAAFFLALQPSKERLKGSFLGNILVKALPAGLTEILAVVLTYLISYFWSGSFCSATSRELITQAAVLLAVISFTTVSYVVLFRICLPFNSYRTVLFIAMLLLGICFFVTDYFVPTIKLLNLSWKNLTWGFSLVAFTIVTLCSGFYFLVDWGIRKIASKSSGGRINEN